MGGERFHFSFSWVIGGRGNKNAKEIVSIVEDIGWRQRSQTKKSEKIVFLGKEVEDGGEKENKKKWKKMKNKENIKVLGKAGKAFWFSLITSYSYTSFVSYLTSGVDLNSITTTL